MKASIHPKYNPEAKFDCNCGAIFFAGSTRDGVHVEVCSSCHPLYTGEKRFIDSLGAVERFQARQKAATTYVKKADRKKVEEKKDTGSMSLKDLLKGFSA